MPIQFELVLMENKLYLQFNTNIVLFSFDCKSTFFKGYLVAIVLKCSFDRKSTFLRAILIELDYE